MRANNLAICRHCENELRRRLGDQAAHRDDLELEHRRQVRKAEATRRAGLSFPILFVEQASRLLKRQLALLEMWVWRLIDRDLRRKRRVQGYTVMRPALTMPRARSVPVFGAWLATHLSVLRRRVDAADMLRELRALDAEIITLIDLPAMRTNLRVGPCPKKWPTDDGEQHCPGEVFAYVPADETAPAYMRCDACGAEWPSRYWFDAGDDIIARALELDHQRELAEEMTKGVA
jgi:hypothetical protein